MNDRPLITCSLNLIKEHCDGTDESFNQVALNLAAFFDETDNSALAEQIFAYLYPGASFSTFEIEYRIGNVLKLRQTGEWFKIVGSVEQGIYVSPLAKYPEAVEFVSRGHIEYKYEIVN